MMRMARIVVVSVLLASVVLVPAQTASAQVRWRRSRAVRHHPPAKVPAKHSGTSVYQYRRPYPADYYYPKYTGAFHARYFDGIPSIYGTRPIRGTAW